MREYFVYVETNDGKDINKTCLHSSKKIKQIYERSVIIGNVRISYDEDILRIYDTTNPVHWKKLYIKE
jgi:hypothetical protein